MPEQQSKCSRALGHGLTPQFRQQQPHPAPQHAPGMQLRERPCTQSEDYATVPNSKDAVQQTLESLRSIILKDAVQDLKANLKEAEKREESCTENKD